MAYRNWLQSVAATTLLAAAPLLLPGVALAQFVPSSESLSDLYPGKAYSPYAERTFPDRVFWGDTHLHTGLSMDAGLFGARLGLEEAYRFARGEEVIASSGQPAKLGRPLDAAYVEARAKWEPLYETTQIKGDGVAHLFRL